MNDSIHDAWYVASLGRTLIWARLRVLEAGTAQVLVFWIALPRLGVRIPRILVDVVTAIAAVVAMIAVGKRAGFSVAALFGIGVLMWIGRWYSANRARARTTGSRAIR